MALQGVKFVTSAVEGDLETLRYMLQNGTSVNCFNPTNGRNALHEAAASGKEPVVRFLIENGINIHSRTMLGRESALHLASSNGQEVCTKILLKRGCRVNDVNKQGGKLFDNTIFLKMFDTLYFSTELHYINLFFSLIRFFVFF
jgi:ankyrin repeat protein